MPDKVLSSHGYNETRSPQRLDFPSTRAILWNRNPLGNPSGIMLIKNEKLKLIIRERTLHLAYKQLKVQNKSFNGFFIGDFEFNEDEGICVRIDRFDPARDGQIKTGTDVQNIRISTAMIPGDFCIPVLLQHGMAFVDHHTSETHSVSEFVKTLQVLKSWCSRKDKLDVSNFLSMKIKCCFQKEDDEILAFVTSGCVVMAEDFQLQPINAIPIIQTALARNLASLSCEVQSQVKTGFVTMDQTRKLLLLIETDPKAYTLPLVGIWISGIDALESVETWAACVRFVRSENILERVFAPPNCYLLVGYISTSPNPVFYEFSLNNGGEEDHKFKFVSCCEGIQLSTVKNMLDSAECAFELVEPNSGLLARNFDHALLANNTTSKSVHDASGSSDTDQRSNEGLDDSLPHNFPSPSPHPSSVQAFQATPSVPDLSLCDSFVLEDVNRKFEEDVDVVSRQSVSKSTKQKNVAPRHTKASIARMKLNKQSIKVDENQKHSRNRLAINFKKNVEKDVKNMIVNTEKEIVQSIDTVKKNYVVDHEDSTPRLPVQIRSHFSNINSIPNFDMQDNLQKEFLDKDGMDVSSNQSYHPENYSDINDDQSFIIDSKKDNGVIMAKDVHTVEDIMRESALKRTLSSPCGEEMNVSPVRSSLNTQKESLSHVSEVNKNFSSEQTKENLQNLNDTAPTPAISDESSKTDLYNLVLAQQEQLTNLQTQLQLFMNHQKVNEESSEKAVNAEEIKKDVRNIQEQQQEQLNHLQQQLELFLHQPTPMPTTDISTQCSIAKNTFSASIGVNTGESLLMAGNDATSSVVNNFEKISELKYGGDKKKCLCCQHCHRKKRKESSKSKETPGNTAKNFHTPSLSELVSEDIDGSMFNDTASSIRTIASSLKGVDIPVFDDSQEECVSPEKTKVLQSKWETSPMLGESASMVAEEERNMPSEVSNEEQVMISESDMPGTQEFYSQMMEQVQKMMAAQNIVNASNVREIITPPNKEVITEEQQINHVRNTTVKQLQQIIKQPNLSPPIDEHPWSLSKSVVPAYPRINYMSMSVDETYNEDMFSNIDEIASKYVSNVFKEKNVVKNKTVKFGNVYEWQTLATAGSMTSVNISCNMSIASKKYLQKYDLVENKTNSTKQPLGDVNGRFVKKKISKNITRTEHKTKLEDKENILDFNKIRSLPKLL